MIPLPSRPAVGVLLLALAAAPAASAKVRVHVEGISGVEKDNVEARLTIRQRGDDKHLDQQQVERLHQQAKKDIEEALQPFGWYSPKIDSKLEGAAPDWNATYTINLGPPTKIAAIDAHFEGEGKDFEDLQAPTKRNRLRVDDRLLHADYETAKKRMSDAAFAQGFLDAQWKQSEILVEPEKEQARITLIMDTGPRYFFGPVSIHQDLVDPELVDRYVKIRQGKPFNPQKLLDLQFALSDLGYFDTIDIEPQRDAVTPEHQVPIDITATERPRTRYDFGVGYGTDTGARGSIGTEWRRLNYEGHTLKTDFQLSQIKDTLLAEYHIPQGTTPGENLAFTATLEKEQIDAGDTTKYTIGTALNKQPGNWQRKLYIDFSHEESDFGDTKATADLLTPGVAFTRTLANDPINARKGWYFFGDVHGAVHNVLSTSSFLQTHVLLRGVYPIGKRFRLLGRAEFGYSIVEEFGELPASQRFFAGGDQSVRGYDYESLGPKDSEGNVIGGKYLTTYSVEGEYRLVGAWGVAAFVDTGGADDNPSPQLSTGVGAGVRYRAPFGNLQFDLAHPLDGGGSPVHIHIGVRVGV